MSWKETDPLAIWQYSTTLPKPPPVDDDRELLKTKSDVTQRFVGSRARIWENLSEIPTTARSEYLLKLFHEWPFWKERWAFKAPSSVLAFTTCLTTTYIGAKINADVFVADRNLSFWQALRKPPTNMPVIGTMVMAGTILPLPFYLYCLKLPMIGDERPLSASAMVFRTALIYLGAGVLTPILATPYMSYYYYIQLAKKVDPKMHNWLDFITLPYECSRSVWRKLPYIIAIQLTVCTLSALSMFWARERVHFSMEANPELIKTIMKDAFATIEQREKEGISGQWQKIKKIGDWFNKKFFFSPPKAEETRISSLDELEETLGSKVVGDKGQQRERKERIVEELTRYNK